MLFLNCRGSDRSSTGAAVRLQHRHVVGGLRARGAVHGQDPLPGQEQQPDAPPLHGTQGE